MSDFNSQAEVWEHLLNGGFIRDIDIEGRGDIVYGFNNGAVTINTVTAKLFDAPSSRSFSDYKNFEKFEFPKWYDKIPIQGILCSVSDKGDSSPTLRVIKSITDRFFVDDNGYEWDNAQPVSLSELAPYIWECE